jgi:uncharacterized glyoxalase superfamily protein PhnB
MADVKPIPDGMNAFIPHLVVEGATEAIEFYKKAFGAEELSCMPAPDGKRVMHACLRVGGSHFFLCDDFPEYCGGQSSHPNALGGTPVTMHLYVKDCDAVFKQAEIAGAKVIMQPQDQFWGDRYGMLADPYGHRWSFATHIADPTPEEMAAASAKAFSQAGESK